MENTLKLIWKSEAGDNFTVGELTFRGGRYYFQYNTEEVKRASEVGFQILEGFPRVNAKYFKEELFKTFGDWLGKEEQRDRDMLEVLKGHSNERFHFSQEVEAS